jgi:hypothetical protein
MNGCRVTTWTSALFLALLCATSASAQTSPDQNDRLANQADRISDGIRDGSLTGSEAARLQRQQARISREAQRFSSDGNLTPAERQKLRQDVNRASGKIWRQRHDPQKRPGTK